MAMAGDVGACILDSVEGTMIVLIVQLNVAVENPPHAHTVLCGFQL